jgi:hypothetical protein
LQRFSSIIIDQHLVEITNAIFGVLVTSTKCWSMARELTRCKFVHSYRSSLHDSLRWAAGMVTVRPNGIGSKVCDQTAALSLSLRPWQYNELYISRHRRRGPQHQKIHNICTVCPNNIITISLLRKAARNQFLLLPSVASFCHRPPILGSCSSVENIGSHR